MPQKLCSRLDHLEKNPTAGYFIRVSALTQPVILFLDTLYTFHHTPRVGPRKGGDWESLADSVRNTRF